MTREPVAVAAAVSAFVKAVLVCLVLFGVPLTADQVVGIIAVVSTGELLAALLFVRARVGPIDPASAAVPPDTRPG